MRSLSFVRVIVVIVVVGAFSFVRGAHLAGQQASGTAAETLSLREAVEIALDRSRELRDAQLGLEIANRRVRDAWGDLFPTLTLTADYTRNVSPAVSFIPAQFFDPTAEEGEFISLQFGADNSWRSSLRLEQPLFRARALLGVGAAARYRALEAETVRGHRQSVVTTVCIAYYDLLLAREEVRLTANSLDRVMESLENTRARRRAGVASDYDVLRLEVEAANLESNLRRARNSETSRRRALAVELDLDEERIEVVGSLAELDMDDPAANSLRNRELLAFSGLGSSEAIDHDRLLERAHSRRSDVTRLELVELLRGTELRAEQLEYLPELSLFGQYDVQAQQNGTPDFFGSGPQRAYAKNIGISVRFPIFRGFKRDAAIDEKRAEHRKARIQTRLVRDQATRQIQDLLDELEETRLRAGAQRLAVEQARRGYDIASAEYREGIGSRLRLTDAEVALRQSEFNYAQAVFDHLSARARLDEAVGQVPLVDVSLDSLGENGDDGR